MRYVDPERVEAAIPSAWHIKATEVSKELLAETDQLRRKRIIERNQSLWQEAGRHLARVMEGKCWYCETRDVRSDHPVDHFRPKGRVAGEDHDGYWWLAFALDNFRYSCTYCNSRRVDVDGGTAGGKQDFFPLAADGVRASNPDDRLEAEKPLLLDPMDQREVCVLLFDETGIPSLNPGHGVEQGDHQRVQVTIDLYHWRHQPLTTNRRLAFKRVSVVCSEADRLGEVFRLTGDQTAKSQRERMVRALSRMADRGSEHSAAALCALRGLRTASPSAAEALEIP